MGKKGRRIRGLASTVAATQLAVAAAWGGGSSSTVDTGAFYPNQSYNWMYSANNIAMKVEGCVWATTDDNEDVGCMEDESGDGTTYWYQMAMCRRAQVAYSVYSTESGSASCSSSNFRGTVSYCWTTAREGDFCFRLRPASILTSSHLNSLPSPVSHTRRTCRICLFNGNIRRVLAHELRRSWGRAHVRTGEQWLLPLSGLRLGWILHNRRIQ